MSPCLLRGSLLKEENIFVVFCGAWGGRITLKEGFKSEVKKDYFDIDYLRPDIKKRAVRGAGVTVFSHALGFFIHMASTIILARLLVPKDFGLVAMVTTFSLLLQNFGMNGFTEAIIQKEDLNHEMMSTLFWINAGISFSLTLFFMALAPLLGWFFREPRLQVITVAVALSIISSGFSTMHSALLKRNMQFHLVSAIGVATQLVCVSTTIALAWCGYGYWALVVNTVCLPLFAGVGYWISCSWRPGLPARGTGVGKMIRFALHTYGNFTMNYFSRNFDNLLVGKFCGSESLGFYKKAYDLFALPVNQLTAPLTSVALAALSRFSNEPEKYRRHYLESVSTLAFIGMGLSLYLTLMAKDLILLVLGPQWNKAGELFAFFGPGIGIMLIYGTQGWLHLSLGRPDRWLCWGIFEFIIQALLFSGGIFFGPKGVAIAWAVSFYLLIGPCLWYAGRPVKLKVSAVFEVSWKYLMAAAVTGIVSWFILYANDVLSPKFLACNIVFRIFISFVFCMSLYLIMVIAFYQGIKPISQLISMFFQMIPGRAQKHFKQ
jgi:PST family polysaccharide transporter